VSRLLCVNCGGELPNIARFGLNCGAAQQVDTRDDSLASRVIEHPPNSGAFLR